MIAPAAFKKMSFAFHQDWNVVYESLDEAIQDSVRILTAEEKFAAKAFLDQALNGDYSDADLADMWNRTSAGGFCIESGASWLLDKLRTALIESP